MCLRYGGGRSCRSGRLALTDACFGLSAGGNHCPSGQRFKGGDRMKRLLILVAAAVAALTLAGVSAAVLVPGVFDPGHTGCPVATFSNGVLHLEKNCATATNAAAGADITGLEGQTFTSAEFTLASSSQCQGGSPRFDVVTTTGLFFLGCNNVTPV